MKCKNDVLMAKVGQKKLNKQVEVDFAVQKKLPDCNRINAKNYVSSGAASPTYNMYQIPQNQFECFEFGCVNSGTLTTGGAATIYMVDDGQSWASGVITFYVKGSAQSATVKISDSAAMTNANSYAVDLTKVTEGADGYKAVFVDLSKTPTKIGTGYAPSSAPAYISIALADGAETDGISSIAIFEEVEDFATNTHVKVGCVTGIDGTFDLELAEETCFSSDGYNVDNLTSIERTITGNAVTANYHKLNPLYKKGSKTTGFDIETVEKTIEAMGETDYASVKLYDMNKEECGFVSAQIPTCNVGDGVLTLISVPSLVDLDEKHFVLIDAGTHVEVVFNKALAGQKVVVSYPKQVDVEEFVINADDANDNKVRMTYVRRYTDGYKYRFVFDNVYVTSFPDSITEDDEYSFSFTITIKKDANGNFGYAYRIIE